MALVITMKATETVLITTKSGDQIKVELPNGTTKQSRIVFFAEDEIKIERVKKLKVKTCKSCFAIYPFIEKCPYCESGNSNGNE